MSELTTTSRTGNDFRWHMLSTASALALIAYAPAARADDDSDRPTVWVELGGQLEQVDKAQTIFSPLFFGDTKPIALAQMVDAQKAPRYAVGGEGKLTFAPHDSDWVFSVGVRYGRSNGSKHLHYQSHHPRPQITLGGAVLYPISQVMFGDGQGGSSEAHVVLDFSAGKDVGLGLFGKGSTSVLSAGVRFAQFHAASNISLHARPIYSALPPFGIPGKYTLHSEIVQSNTAVIESRRSTHAIGPSLSWDSSVPIVGDNSRMTMALDWGVNAAILFGRQRANVLHHTTRRYFKGRFVNFGSQLPLSSYANHPPHQNRSRFVTITNIGGFAGASFRYANAKVSFGYRADFFFGAMDTGIDTAKKSNVGFYGPFATISVGLGG